MVKEEDVISALRSVIDPELRMDIVSMGMIKNLSVRDGNVSFELELTTPACPFNAQIEQQAREAVSSIPGVKSVDMKVSARVWSGKRIPMGPSPDILPDVKNIIAIASGKGGVGKSTVAVNIALALAETGASSGLLDADIYGPTIPKLLKDIKYPDKADNNKIMPAEGPLGLKVMSIGLLITDDTPVIWRGPLVAGAVRQMLTDVDWGKLDYLIVDLPPGTGDASLTLAQTIPLTGVVIVTTPQDAAVRIAMKALQMFRRLGVEIVGIVENMSYFICPSCGEKSYIFGSDSAKAACSQLGVPLLGEIPLEPSIREMGDEGTPIVLSNPDSKATESFRNIARSIAGRISILASKTRGVGAT